MRRFTRYQFGLRLKFYFQRIRDAHQIILTHLRIDRQKYRMILREFGLTQVVALLSVQIGCLAVRAHDAAPCGDALIEQALHHLLLIDTVRQTHAVALPIGARPFRL